MWLRKLHQHGLGRPASGRISGSSAARRRGRRPGLEQLEARTVLTSFTAATVSDLIADIHAANQAGGSNTITLMAPMPSPYVLTAVDDITDGPTGLPVIAANDNLTIVGNGDAIARSTTAGTPNFRLLDVAAGATLTLQNLTLQGGLALGAGVSAEGGAVYNQGSLDLEGATVQHNTAQGLYGVGSAAGQSAAGGGLFSGGILTLDGGSTVQNNQVIGGNGGGGRRAFIGSPAEGGGPGGNANGGGLYVAGGTVTLSSATLSANTAQGGQGGGGAIGSGLVGGIGCGGGLYVAGGSATLTRTALSVNTAQGGQGGVGANAPAKFSLAGGLPLAGGAGANGLGGGLNVAGGAVTLNSATLSANIAQGGQGGQGGAGGYGSLGGNGGAGGNGFGAGLNVAGGKVTLTSATLSSNTARGGVGGQPGKEGAAAKFEYAGGNGGAGGNGYGGGLHASAGTITLRQASVSRNSAQGGAGAPGNPGFPGFPSGQPGLPGLGEGGGLYIDALATAYLDAFTQANVINNTAPTSDPNIHGPWHHI